MSSSRKRFAAPAWGQLAALVLAIVWVTLAPAEAQPRKPDKPAAGAVAQDPVKLGGDKPGAKADGKSKQPKTFDFTALDLNGRMRSPQLLYFLERANEELERASLEKRSFIPHMVRSMEEEQL
jgi:hypothetical protein